jgi:hypothetical protein
MKVMKECIDWEKLTEDLQKELSNERIWEMGYGDDPRNPHTATIMSLEDLLGYILTEEYDDAIVWIEDMYGLEYFNDYLLKEKDNDYVGNYAELILHEMHNLYELEAKVPASYRQDIHSMAVSLQAMWQDIQRNRDLDNDIY